MDVQKIMQQLEQKHPGELEYLQAVREVLNSVKDVYNQHPEFERAKIIERILENRLGISCDFSGVTGKLDSAFQTQMLDLEGVDAVFYRFSPEQLRSSWENGQILDYTDYLDQMPNLTRLFEENPLLYQ